MGISKNLRALLENIENIAVKCGRNPSDILLLTVSKQRSIQEIHEAYLVGMKDFAENRVQEALEKMEQLPADIRWHFVGKLQKNKVSKVIGKFVLIHSVDTPELAEKISQTSLSRGIVTNILLEANTSNEPTKSGLSPTEWEEAFVELLDCKGIRIHGLMTMAPLTENEGTIRKTFTELRALRDRLRRIANGRADLSTLSMGMTNDYPIAIQEGATILRIGSAIFTPQ